ncbi:MAG TPA: hypothetical protein VNV66_04625 [Pilimelia sp.]|nr:hypothetical protein [Pilimelia sp.]
MSGLLAASAVAALAHGLVSCGAAGSGSEARPLSPAEARRLAGMRLENHRDARAGLHAVIGPRDREVRLAGWVDWARPMAYLSVRPPGSGAPPGLSEAVLVQAVPGLVATRPQAAARGSAATPPVAPPPDRWTVRPADPAATPLDALLALLFAMGHPARDDAGLLAHSEARWLRRDRAAGVDVDVVLGPAVPSAPRAAPGATGSGHTAGPDAPARLAAMGGAVQYWLDDRARVHRVEALLARGLPVRVDLNRGDRRSPGLVAALGGAPVAPRPVTAAESAVLAQLRRRNHAAGGGRLRITLPTTTGAHTAAGWLDWRDSVAYLRVTEPGAQRARLLWADRTGVATRAAPRTRAARPPLPAPGAGWQFAAWPTRRDAHGGFDLDLLLNELLLAGLRGRQEGAARQPVAHRLRGDVLAGAAVTVYEVRKEAERGVRPGAARLRYWVDGAGVLRRLELRTRSGGFAQADVLPGRVPRLSVGR